KPTRQIKRWLLHIAGVARRLAGARLQRLRLWLGGTGGAQLARVDGRERHRGSVLQPLRRPEFGERRWCGRSERFDAVWLGVGDINSANGDDSANDRDNAHSILPRAGPDDLPFFEGENRVHRHQPDDSSHVRNISGRTKKFGTRQRVPKLARVPINILTIRSNPRYGIPHKPQLGNSGRYVELHPIMGKPKIIQTMRPDEILRLASRAEPLR